MEFFAARFTVACSKNGTITRGRLWVMMDFPMNRASFGHERSCAAIRRRAAQAVLFLLCVTMTLRAQSPGSQEGDRKPRQKIGLVLEGGGALGLAHIGVLRWLYEHHVPVDLVAGTSMGGLVGGFYATGRSPEQIQQLIQNL